MADQNTNVTNSEQTQDLGELLRIRREKLKALQDEGRDPFAITKFDVTHHTQDIKDNFDAMEGQSVSVAGRLIWCSILVYIKVFLWSLLFFIPGVVAAYRYRFALYNLCENPELGVMEALAMSKAQTKGYKLDLFVLDVTFLGWSLLCALTAGILTIWVAPYVQQTNLAYFDAIKAEKGIGSLPGEEPAEDDTFYPDDRF